MENELWRALIALIRNDGIRKALQAGDILLCAFRCAMAGNVQDYANMIYVCLKLLNSHQSQKAEEPRRSGSQETPNTGM